MYERVSRFLDICNILYLVQFGFCEKLSTLYAIIGMTETIKEAINNGMFGCGVFIDLQRAFDAVDHSILLKKLEHYDIKGVEHSWFSSYLSKRKQFVSVNGSTSDYLEITVPASGKLTHSAACLATGLRLNTGSSAGRKLLLLWEFPTFVLHYCL